MSNLFAWTFWGNIIKGMYDIGTHISFKKEQRKSVANFLVDVGTSFILRVVDGTYRAEVRIPVAYQTSLA